MFPVRAFFIVQIAWPCNILRGAMILVNGGLVILLHVCDDLRSAQSGHAGELQLRTVIYNVRKKEKQEIWDQRTTATLVHTLS